jgi:hypothetical protein
MTEHDLAHRRVLSLALVIAEGNPGALVVVKGLAWKFPRQSLSMMCFLAAKGPRGEALWRRFADSCRHDTDLFGRDLLARMAEFVPPRQGHHGHGLR